MSRLNEQWLRLYVRLTDRLRREDGQDMIEYALIVSVISAVVVAAAAAVLEPAFAKWAKEVGKLLKKGLP